VLFILDETRTGLGRSGKLWTAEHSGVRPDMLITGKGLSGGLYPVSAVLMSTPLYDACINSHKFAYISSLGGNEIGCLVAQKVLEVVSRAETLENVRKISEHLTSRFAELCSRHSDLLAPGTTLGGMLTLRVHDPKRAPSLQRAVHEAGVLCHSVSTITPSVLKFLPVLTIDTAVADEIADAVEAGVRSWASEDLV
jgi:acetylornithine aminotransferase